MKKIIIAFALFFAGASAQAQVFSIGPRVGISSSKVQVDEFLSGDRKISEGDKVLGFHAGLYSRLQIPGVGLYIQPELLFSSSGGNVVIEDGGGISTAEYKFNKMDVPVLVGVRVLRVLRINAGPTFNFLINAKGNMDGESHDVTDNYNRKSVGYQAGIGFDIWKLILDIKYENSLSSFGDTMFGVPTDHRNPQFIFSMGFRL
jgi:hypothetical protein